MKNDSSKPLSFDERSAKQFVKAYNAAKVLGKESFIFEGNEYVINYAYYLIQYLEMNHVLAGKFDSKKIYTIKNIL